MFVYSYLLNNSIRFSKIPIILTGIKKNENPYITWKCFLYFRFAEFNGMMDFAIIYRFARYAFPYSMEIYIYYG